jgi:hypothetical protein
MIKLQLINVDIIYDTDCLTSRAGIIREWTMPFVSSTLKSFEKWRSPLFGATGNFKHQILPALWINKLRGRYDAIFIEPENVNKIS